MKKTSDSVDCTDAYFVLALAMAATLPVKPITQADLPDLKGEWKGYYEEEAYRTTHPID